MDEKNLDNNELDEELDEELELVKEEILISPSFSANEDGVLTIGGVPADLLAREFGTPLYVLDEDRIRYNIKSYQMALEQYYPGKSEILYASKALCFKGMYEILSSCAIGADVVSAGEIYTANSAHFPMSKLFFHGNSKTEKELKMALEYGVGHIVVDNLEELFTLNEIAGELGARANIFLRLKPGVESHTFKAVMTGQIDSKFGFCIENEEAIEAVKKVLECENIKLCGVHSHIGSQIFEWQGFKKASQVLMTFIKVVQDELEYTIRGLNLGGGFGIKYTEDDKPRPAHEYIHALSDAIITYANEYELDLPDLYIEPGRSIVGDAGATIYTVKSIKDIEGARCYVLIDGGMTDNPRYALYQSKYEIIAATKVREARDETVTIAGRCCESGDLIAEHIKIAHLEPGDLVAVLCTGAYNYSMASNYNRVCRPPIIMVRTGIPRVVVKGESFEDLIRNDV